MQNGPNQNQIICSFAEGMAVIQPCKIAKKNESLKNKFEANEILRSMTAMLFEKFPNDLTTKDNIKLNKCHNILIQDLF